MREHCTNLKLVEIGKVHREVAEVEMLCILFMVLLPAQLQIISLSFCLACPSLITVLEMKIPNKLQLEQSTISSVMIRVGGLGWVALGFSV